MTFCPGCGYEFREGLTRCPDCDMDLVADLDEVDGAQSARLRGGKTMSVLTATRASVEMLADLLDAEGIPSMLKPADTSDAAQVTAPEGAAIELHVSEKDAEAHRELLAELIAEVRGRDEEPQAAA